MPATVSPAARLQAAQQQHILVGVRVRPEVRAVARVRAEEGYPYAEKCKLEALRLEAHDMRLHGVLTEAGYRAF